MKPAESHSETIARTVKALSDCRGMEALFCRRQAGTLLPSGAVLAEIIALARAILFPGYYGKATLCSDTMTYRIGVDTENFFRLLCSQIEAGLCFGRDGESAPEPGDSHERARQLAATIVERLPEIRRKLAADVEAAYLNDPAAESYGEVIACYPVIKALTCYRVAHELQLLGVPLVPRIITEQAHSETGIDIHPAAQIGESFTIDHGTGVVIGATCIIGNRVKLYQGVTLGARTFPLDEAGNPVKHIPRHPILEDDVVVYSNATILGRVTIGRGAVVGGNVWLTRDVPAGETVRQGRTEDLRPENNENTSKQL